jgi:hypothetical protein
MVAHAFTATLVGGPTALIEYVSGDNASVVVVAGIVDRVGELEIAVLHVGGARLEGRFGGALLTLGADEAVAATRLLGSTTVVAVRQEGWAHFSQGPERLREAFAAAAIADRLETPARGAKVTV